MVVTSSFFRAFLHHLRAQKALYVLFYHWGIICKCNSLFYFLMCMCFTHCLLLFVLKVKKDLCRNWFETCPEEALLSYILINPPYTVIHFKIMSHFTQSIHLHHVVSAVFPDCVGVPSATTAAATQWAPNRAATESAAAVTVITSTVQ